MQTDRVIQNNDNAQIQSLKPLLASLPDESSSATHELRKWPRVVLKRRLEHHVAIGETSVAQESGRSKLNSNSTRSTEERRTVTNDPLSPHDSRISSPSQQQQLLTATKRAHARTGRSSSDMATPSLLLKSEKRPNQNARWSCAMKFPRKMSKREVHAERMKALPQEVHIFSE